MTLLYCHSPQCNKISWHPNHWDQAKFEFFIIICTDNSLTLFCHQVPMTYNLFRQILLRITAKIPFHQCQDDNVYTCTLPAFEVLNNTYMRQCWIYSYLCSTVQWKLNMLSKYRGRGFTFKVNTYKIIQTNEKRITQMFHSKFKYKVFRQQY